MKLNDILSSIGSLFKPKGQVLGAEIATPTPTPTKLEGLKQQFTKMRDTGNAGWNKPQTRPLNEPEIRFLNENKESFPNGMFPRTTPTPTAKPTLNNIKRNMMPTQPIPSPTRPPVYQNEVMPQERVDYLETNILPITRKQGIPDALVASQWATEGGRAMGNTANNMFGILQPGTGQLVQYPNTQRNVEDYALTVRNILKAKGVDVGSGVDAYQALMALQAGDRPRYEGHNANQWDYTQTVMNTPEWRKYYKPL